MGYKHRCSGSEEDQALCPSDTYQRWPKGWQMDKQQFLLKKEYLPRGSNRQGVPGRECS